jgi:hypothetical protein
MKTLDERRIELERMAMAQNGFYSILEVYGRTMMQEGSLGTPGIMVEGMIREILDIEFPNQPK